MSIPSKIECVEYYVILSFSEESRYLDLGLEQVLQASFSHVIDYMKALRYPLYYGESRTRSKEVLQHGILYRM
jgi:hypothetical protein